MDEQKELKKELGSLTEERAEYLAKLILENQKEKILNEFENPELIEFSLEEFRKTEKERLEFFKSHLLVGSLKLEFKFETEEEPTTDKPNTLEVIRPIKADNLNMPNNRFLNMVTGNEEVPYDGSPFPVMKSERTEEIESTVTLNYENDDIQIAEKDKRFTEYDRCVHEAICTLHEVGNTSFTPDQVYRTMNGLTADKTVSPPSTQKVVESIDKMRKMQVTINYSDEFRKRLKSEDNADYYYAEGSIIQAEKRYARLGGHEVLAYYMLPKPIIYRYAQATRQVITIPTKLLSTADVIRNTPENTTLRNYLVRRIEAMKNRKNSIKSNRILFETIYKQLGLEKPTAKKSMKVRDAIEKYLEHYKSKNYIKDFKFYKTGRTFKGIEISL